MSEYTKNLDITPGQSRAARILLGVRREDVATAAGINERTLIDWERGVPKPIRATKRAIRMAYEEMDVEFIDQTDDKGPGLQLTKPVDPSD